MIDLMTRQLLPFIALLIGLSSASCKRDGNEGRQTHPRSLAIFADGEAAALVAITQAGSVGYHYQIALIGKDRVPRWHAPWPRRRQGASTTGLAVDDGSIFVILEEIDGPTQTALLSRSGSTIWLGDAPLGGRIVDAFIVGEVIIVVRMSNVVAFAKSTGKVLWIYKSNDLNMAASAGRDATLVYETGGWIVVYPHRGTEPRRFRRGGCVVGDRWITVRGADESTELLELSLETLETLGSHRLALPTDISSLSLAGCRQTGESWLLIGETLDPDPEDRGRGERALVALSVTSGGEIAWRAQTPPTPDFRLGPVGPSPPSRRYLAQLAFRIKEGQQQLDDQPRETTGVVWVLDTEEHVWRPYDFPGLTVTPAAGSTCWQFASVPVIRSVDAKSGRWLSERKTSFRSYLFETTPSVSWMIESSGPGLNALAMDPCTLAPITN